MQRSPAGDRSAGGSPLQPFASAGEHRLQLGELSRGAALQCNQRIIERIDDRQQVNHPPTQLTGVFQGVRSSPFVAELADHQLQRVEGGDHRPAHAADLVGAASAGQVGIAVVKGLGKPVAGGADHHWGQPTRPENGANDGCADDAQADFLGAGRRYVKHRQGVIHNRQCDHRQGVAGQHQHVVVGRAQVQRKEQQGAGPQGDGNAQQQRRLYQRWHQEDRPPGTEQGAHGTVQRLGAGWANEGAGNDVHRGHGPVGPRQLHEQGNVQGDHRGREGAHPVEPVPRRGDRAEEAVHATPPAPPRPAASKARSTRKAASRSA